MLLPWCHELYHSDITSVQISMANKHENIFFKINNEITEIISLTIVQKEQNQQSNMSKNGNKAKRHLLDDHNNDAQSAKKARKIQSKKDEKMAESKNKQNGCEVDNSQSASNTPIKGKSTRFKPVAKNNNATIIDKQPTKQQKKFDEKSKGRSSQISKMTETKVKEKIIPIIQTRRMKAKIAQKQDDLDLINDREKELHEFNQIDVLSRDEILAGESDTDVEHDGVELSIIGSDLDDFPDDGMESGEVSSDDEVLNDNTISPRNLHRVALKVVKVNNRDSAQGIRSDAFDKFAHLKNDPDFRQFLSEMVDDRLSGKRGEVSTNKSKAAPKGNKEGN